MNPFRILIGTLVGAIVCFVGDGMIHGILLADDWKAVVEKAGLVEGEHGQIWMFVIYDVLKAFGIIFLYATMRTRFRPGPMTAILAGFTAWFLMAVIPNVTWINIPIIPTPMVAKWMLLEGVPILLAAVAAASLYQEGDRRPAAT